MSQDDHFRREAERCRRLAAQISDRAAVAELEALAKEYEAQTQDRLAALNEALTVAEVDGEITFTGPGRLAGSLTPTAAIVSGERLIEAADQAVKRPSK